MSRGRLDRIKQLLLELQELDPSAAAARLEQLEPDDAELREEVLSLLRQRTVGGLRTGAGRARVRDLLETGSEGGSPPLPERMGPYTIVGELGRGGMGVVYRAAQHEPIEREVALKLVPLGFDSAGIVRRFEEERRLLSRLEHPGIARVLDAGADTDGRPYFVMELVEGVDILEYVRGRNLDTRAILHLFIRVCRAVQHAHQKGILHRDLKPSNLLVAEIDGRPVPKIIDFGIAKALEDENGPGTLRTREGQILGTLEYMSPEQASGRPGDIDTRSDVYSLCAVLYEALTGRLPVPLDDCSTPEAIRRILEEEPAVLGRTSTGTDGISRDVRTVVLKGLEKDPDRRYDSMAALAGDLERILDDEPILARPPSAGYQLSKFAARHRALVVSTGVVFALVLASAIVMSIMFTTQRRLRLQAETEARRAERVGGFLTDLIVSVRPTDSGSNVTVLEVLDEATRKLEGTMGEHPTDLATLAVTLANAYDSLDEYEPSARVLYGALARVDSLAPDSRESASLLTAISTTEFYRGDYAAAVAACDRAAAILRSLPEVDPLDLANVLHNQGYLLMELNRPAEGEPLLREALALRERDLGPGSSDTLVTLDALARSILAQGRFADAREAAVLSQERREAHLEPGHLWRAPRMLARVETCLGNYDEADRLIEESLSLIATHAGEESMLYGSCLLQKARLEIDRERPEEALLVLDRARDLLVPYLGENHARIGSVEQLRSQARHAAGRHLEAEADADRALELFQAAYGDSHSTVASVLADRGRAQFGAGRTRQALASLELGLEIARRVLPPDDWQVTSIRLDLAAIRSATEAAGADDELSAVLRHFEELPAGERVRFRRDHASRIQDLP